MESILITILVLIAIAIIVLVLVQHGKGADIGASFGSGASSTVFGSQGSASFLVKLTFGLAAVFFIISILLTNMASRSANINLAATQPPSVPTPATNIPVQVPVKADVQNKVESNVPNVPVQNQKNESKKV